MEKHALKKEKVKWKKTGVIFCPDHNFPWMTSHASYPWAEFLSGKKFKIYFSTRNATNRSCIGYVIINIDEPARILEVSSSPVLTPGEIGTFDYNGVSFGCLCEANGKKFLYYLGWNVLVDIPWRNTIGLAIYDRGTGRYERFSKAPVVGIHHMDPFNLTYPCVMFDEGLYKMWYGSSLHWGPTVKDTVHLIKYATSGDGINWDREGVVCFRPENKDRYVAVKPFVLKEKGIYKMWYTYRDADPSKDYRIGYAESPDGIGWTQKDDLAGIDVSNDGWDSNMVCYPFVFDFEGRRYMLYNGNGYGQTGFGLAILEP